jgi:hypothetical protein
MCKYFFVCHTLSVNAISVERPRWSPMSVPQALALYEVEQKPTGIDTSDLGTAEG